MRVAGAGSLKEIMLRDYAAGKLMGFVTAAFSGVPRYEGIYASSMV
jgi:hypothetical protein